MLVCSRYSIWRQAFAIHQGLSWPPEARGTNSTVLYYTIRQPNGLCFPGLSDEHETSLVLSDDIRIEEVDGIRPWILRLPNPMPFIK